MFSGEEQGDAALPLRGVRVLDLTVVWAGPECTMLLGDLGAEVIRVENTHIWQTNTRGYVSNPTEELLRNQPNLGRFPGNEIGDRPWNRHPIFNVHARNKLSCTLDLRNALSRQTFWDLVAISDVICENNAVETMEKLGVTYESLRQVRPDIIYLRMPPYGTTGPYRQLRAFGSNMESVIGHTLLVGYEDADPSSTGAVYAADYFGGSQAAFAAMAAIHHRNSTGEGQYVEYAQAEGALAMMGAPFMDYVLNGRLREHGQGNRSSFAVQGCYRCQDEGVRSENEARDRWVCITIASDDEWRAFSLAIDSPQWTADERFSMVIGRSEHADEIDARITDWTSTRMSHEVMYQLQAAGIAAGPVMDALDAYEDPQLEARGFFRRVTQADCGTHRYPGPVFSLSETPVTVRLPPVMLGEHNEYVYRELTGIDDEHFSDLSARGIIGSRFLPAETEP